MWHIKLTITPTFFFPYIQNLVLKTPSNLEKPMGTTTKKYPIKPCFSQEPGKRQPRKAETLDNNQLIPHQQRTNEDSRFPFFLDYSHPLQLVPQQVLEKRVWGAGALIPVPCNKNTLHSITENKLNHHKSPLFHNCLRGGWNFHYHIMIRSPLPSYWVSGDHLEKSNEEIFLFLARVVSVKA